MELKIGLDKVGSDELEKIEIIVRMVGRKGNIKEKTIFTLHDIHKLEECNDKKSVDLIFPDIRINLMEQIVYYKKDQISLSRYEFNTLCFLAQHPNWVFSKEQIYEAVWNESGEHCGTAVTNVISQLRRKLNQENPENGYIRTVIGRGYKFVD